MSGKFLIDYMYVIPIPEIILVFLTSYTLDIFCMYLVSIITFSERYSELSLSISFVSLSSDLYFYFIDSQCLLKQ